MRDGESNWTEVKLNRGIKALVLLNLQSYGGGRDLWGLSDVAKDQVKGWQTPIFNDGLIEVSMQQLHRPLSIHAACLAETRHPSTDIAGQARWAELSCVTWSCSKHRSFDDYAPRCRCVACRWWA